MTRCKLCHGTGRLNHARESVYCTCQAPFAKPAAKEIAGRLLSESAVLEIIMRYFGEYMDKVERGLPF